MLGLHYDIKDNNIKDLYNNIKKIGGNLIQIITNKKLRDEKLENIISNKINVVIHAPYFVNLCKITKTNNIVYEDIKFASKINALGVVLHTGKITFLNKKTAENNVIENLKNFINYSNSLDNKVNIFIETASGQGTELCSDIEDFCNLYLKIKKQCKINNLLKVCLDTCHIFAAGYNIKNKEYFNNYIKYINSKIGDKEIRLIHLNDSKNDLGSNIDRHENIGNGFIGIKSLKYIFNYFYEKKIPIVLETNDVNFKMLFD